MKILFFPSDINGKLSHITRCSALAQYLKSQSHECAFVIHTKSNINFINLNFKTFFVPIENKIQKIGKSIFSKKTKAPLFLTISNLNYQVIRDGLTNEKIIRKIIEQYRKIIDSFKPDLLICDTNLIAGIIAKIFKIPILQLVRAGFYPVKPQFIWWEPLPVNLSPPNIMSVFNPILDDFNISPIEQAEDLLNGDLNFIPSIPEIEPADLDSSTHYVGPLLVRKPETALPTWFKNKKEPLIYISIDEAATNIGRTEFLRTIVKAFQHEKVQVIVAANNKLSFKKEFGEIENILIKQWVPEREIINQSDLIIFHGDYNTMMETIQAGKPSIVIPFHSEQESNGRRLKNSGSSLICKLSENNTKVIRKNWEFGDYTYLINTKYDLTATKLQNLAQQILTSSEFFVNSQRLKKKCNKYEGAKRAFSIISKCLLN